MGKREEERGKGKVQSAKCKKISNEQLEISNSGCAERISCCNRSLRSLALRAAKTTHDRSLAASKQTAEIPDQVRNDGIGERAIGVLSVVMTHYPQARHPERQARHPELVSGSLLKVTSLVFIERGQARRRLRHKTKSSAEPTPESHQRINASAHHPFCAVLHFAL